MASENNKNAEQPIAVNYADRVAAQQALVDKLQEDYKKKPSPELQDELRRKNDTLLHIKNMAKGETKVRAKAAAAKARSLTLTRAVQQPL